MTGTNEKEDIQRRPQKIWEHGRKMMMIRENLQTNFQMCKTKPT